MKGYELLGLKSRPPYLPGRGYGRYNLQGQDYNDSILLEELIALGIATASYLALLEDADGRTVAGALKRLEARGIIEKVPAEEESRYLRSEEKRDLGWTPTGAAYRIREERG